MSTGDYGLRLNYGWKTENKLIKPDFDLSGLKNSDMEFVGTKQQQTRSGIPPWKL